MYSKEKKTSFVPFRSLSIQLDEKRKTLYFCSKAFHFSGEQCSLALSFHLRLDKIHQLNYTMINHSTENHPGSNDPIFGEQSTKHDLTWILMCKVRRMLVAGTPYEGHRFGDSFQRSRRQQQGAMALTVQRNRFEQDRTNAQPPLQNHQNTCLFALQSGKEKDRVFCFEKSLVNSSFFQIYSEFNEIVEKHQYKKLKLTRLSDLLKIVRFLECHFVFTLHFLSSTPQKHCWVFEAGSKMV